MPLSISEISEPIASHLDDFNDFFKGLIRSKAALLDIVVRYILKQRGKRVRPTLVFLSAALCGQVSRRTYIGAALVELLHTATLVHDDVVDEADKRRGMPSINAVWKNKVAVLVGDYLLSRGLLIAVDNEEFDYLRITSTSVRRMSEGELLQIQKSKQKNLDEETYFRIISDKTASLISTCCEIGAVSVTDSIESRNALRDYGELVGLAFQIQDDILDYTSRSSIVGKPTGNDIKEKKITLPLIYACEHADKSEGRAIVKSIKSGNLSAKSIEDIISFVERNQGISRAQEKAHSIIGEAKAKIAEFPDSPAKMSLMNFADYVVLRTK
jgi:octaprenyl-diphosphate synthase